MYTLPGGLESRRASRVGAGSTRRTESSTRGNTISDQEGRGVASRGGPFLALRLRPRFRLGEGVRDCEDSSSGRSDLLLVPGHVIP